MRTDAELLRSSDPEAFGEFYRRHVTAVTAYLGRRIRRPDVLFELMAETFARAYEHRGRHDPRRGPAVAWLLTVARSVLADAERRGQVSDAARGRLGLEPFAFDDEARAMVAERGRTDFVAALSGLPESQRIAAFRRLLDDEDDEPAPTPIRASHTRTQDERRRHRDPFDELGERLFLAAGGRLPRSRRRSLVLVTAAVLLFGAGLAAAALRFAGGEDPVATPTPTPTPSVDPGLSPDPSATPRLPRFSRPRPGPGGVVVPTPAPPPPADIAFVLTPDLRAGRVGWCVELTLRTMGIITAKTGCSPSGAPDTMLIAAGGAAGAAGAGYAIVDAAVREIRLRDGRRITPRRDPDVPAGWRAATWNVSGALPTFTLHDAAGGELPARAGAPLTPLTARRVPAAKPPRERCAIRAARSARLRPSRARLVDTIAALSAVSPSYLTCASTTFRAGSTRLPAAVLLNASDPDAPAPRLPSTAGLSVRREGPGWLVVSGGSERQRARVLRALTVTGP